MSEEITQLPEDDASHLRTLFLEDVDIRKMLDHARTISSIREINDLIPFIKSKLNAHLLSLVDRYKKLIKRYEKIRYKYRKLLYEDRGEELIKTKQKVQGMMASILEYEHLTEGYKKEIESKTNKIKYQTIEITKLKQLLNQNSNNSLKKITGQTVTILRDGKTL